MKEKTLMERLLDQINDLMALAQVSFTKEINSEISPQEIQDKLSELEKQIDAMDKINNSLISQAGLTEADLQPMMKKVPDTVPPADRKLMEKINLMKQEALSIKRELGNAIDINKHKKAVLGKEGKRAGDVRKKKFKALGGKKDWLPL